MKKIVATGVAGLLLSLPLAGTASADLGRWNDPAYDSARDTDDITGYYLNHNTEVMVTAVDFARYDAEVLRNSDLYADLDVNGDGVADYTLYKPQGEFSAVLLSGEDGSEIANCPANFHIYTTGTVAMSTTASCVGNPDWARVQYALVSGASIDVAPDSEEFSPAVFRGYRVIGAIADRWRALGQDRGYLGMPLTDEAGSARGGRYNLFQGGAIYWTEATGAHAVRGAIRDRWSKVGAEWSVLGYPKTDEVRTGGRPGAVNLFEGGSVYWSAATGAHEMYGAILGAWGSQGYEGGRLGFPTTGEFDSPDGRKQEFQGGNIVWTPQRGAVIAYR
ncbi:LGFP repeat-containing protein [Modestobacter sp. VKM Ac-2984]|uniref:LGFP repeat-containing protein n=1 Tax=Modestobacter sp. VKM Ac-2984 TaxID=3004138 RepID=UPI0022AA2712|nr:hypothetical protein [Modestobacter sp. VKM Ac-2984]MCZ2817077.1 hypothetical protein [Modestobacter sp. VKM Ac-2984]